MLFVWKHQLDRRQQGQAKFQVEKLFQNIMISIRPVKPDKRHKKEANEFKKRRLSYQHIV